ncbi:hypothetical protein SSCHL_2048 [Staphylococcus schleiferi]|nr:hypothetical protein SSCHL_2048 [Staphylococcus schleiferi]
MDGKTTEGTGQAEDYRAEAVPSESEAIHTSNPTSKTL